MTTTSQSLNHQDLLALERFVVGNEDLQTLEERLGRFNVFDALGVARAEIRHSNFLAWLLDPTETHGQTDLFLKALLMDIARHAREQGVPPAFSPVELDGADLGSVEVRREWRNIDLLVHSKAHGFVVAVENKIDAGEHSDQLARYKQIIAEGFGNRPTTHVFLTPDGRPASEDGWVSYSYAEVHRVFSRVMRTNGGALGSDVAVFLEHYLRLVGSRMMNDSQIDELCRRIYKNHRAAIDLIVEKAGAGGNAVLNRIAELIKEDARWAWINTTSKWIFFMPNQLRRTIRPIGTRPQYDKQEWVLLRFDWDPNKGRVSAGLTVWPTSDDEVRKRVIERLTQNREEFELRKRGTAEGDWTNLMKEHVLDFDPDSAEGSMEELDIMIKAKLDELWGRFQHLHVTIGEVIGVHDQ